MDFGATFNTVSLFLGGTGSGVILKYWLDIRVGRRARLLDEKLKHVIHFFKSADLLWRARHGRAIAHISMEGSKNGSEKDFEFRRSQLEKAQTESKEAFLESMSAFTSISLLIPKASKEMKAYLDACDAAWIPVDNPEVREQTRVAAEKAVMKQLK